MSSLLIAVIYLVFVSLGLPDSLLGSGWPTMQHVFNVPSSWAGYVSMTISAMTIISALLGPSLVKKFHTKWIIIFSILLTVGGLFGFSCAKSYFVLFAFAIPYGLGAGAIDASINNYVAIHFSAAEMSFLHCFYGVGAVISPNIMGLALKYAHWNQGYRWTACLQIFILFICIISLPLWKKNEVSDEDSIEESASIGEAIKVPGVLPTLISFFAYCASEATCFLWTSSYFAGTKTGLSAQTIASYGSLIFGGLMLGRLISGFASKKVGDNKLIRIGFLVELIGIFLVMVPVKTHIVAVVGFITIGTGMGPIYPSIQHMAPVNFGKKNSMAVIGLQMAFAYTGSTFMPMVFGQIQQKVGIAIMPYYLLFFACLFAYMRVKTQNQIK